ncbi:Uncharacterised protein [Mycobacteroides abscessus subsp. abscessus]|nr:Uncharacterised protein [Mycobacteroides abscessus subsp. abscessus]
MEQDRLVTLQPVGLAEQVLRGQALKHDGRAFFKADAVGQLDHLRGRHVAHFGIRAERALAVGHTIAHLQMLDARTDGVDHACAFKAQA